MTQILFSLSTHTHLLPFLRCYNFFPWLSPLILPCEKTPLVTAFWMARASGGYKYVMLMFRKHTFSVSGRGFFQVRNSLFSCQKQPLFMSETVMFAETQVPSSSVCRLYHLFQGVVEILFREKLLDVYVHTVSPVVVRIGRDIYTLLVGIGESQPLVRCQPVL